MANFDRLLAIDGRLCVTPAEADRLPPGRFVADGPTETGIYRRTGVGSAIHAALATVRPLSASVAETPSLPASGTLAAARVLADAGHLDEAHAACEQLLHANRADVDALTLAAVVHLAAGRPNDAFDALRKALYLVPDHAEAMTHMMGLCERRGDAARAAALRRRLARTEGV